MFLASCAEKTKITGHISNADNAMLYFECNKMSNIEVLDSVKLNKKGKDYYLLEIKVKHTIKNKKECSKINKNYFTTFPNFI